MKVEDIKSKDPTFKPALVIVQVGGREDSNVYIRMKLKAAEEIGISASCLKLDKDTIDSHLVTDAVSPSKDVDGLCTTNQGRVATGDLNSGFLPCTPNGCIKLIERTGVKVAGSTAVVLGRSKIVGTPAAELLKWMHATVTVCHSKTTDLPSVCRTADILVVAVGRAEMVKRDWVKPGAVVIDCGINAIADPTKKSGQRLVGDVDYNEVVEVASHLTPVPGGVGPMTVAMLMYNTVQGAIRSHEAR